ncbi:MAG: iron-containing alcohol dehydrogenase [Acidimicrobiia bacterium]|nr:iron-containing alcohol dehydrogenase [Acidimicrobiia bacterium]
MLKRLIHAVVVFISRFAAKLLPDRVPVTFVGADAVRELAQAIGHRGVTKALVVTDATLVELGIVDRITTSLDDQGIIHHTYDGVSPDPTFTQVEEGFARYVSEGCDGVIAVGGGSPMDAAKVIAAMATNDKSLAQLEGKFKVRRPPAPLFAVPTTAGTGSEGTVAAVVSDPDTHAKKFFLDPKLLPSMVALDPTLMTGLPAPITAATGMDALTHAVESFIAKTSTPATEEYALTAVRLVFAHLPTAVHEGDDLEARSGMALASYYAGLAFTRTSVGYVHAVAHTLGAYYGTPHGLANAIVLPHVLAFSKADAQAQLARLADVLDLGGSTPADKADRFIDAVRDLEATIGIPATLDTIKPADIGPIAEQALAEAWLDYPVPTYMTQAQCEALLTRIADPLAA